MTQQAKILSFDKARRAQGDRSHSLDSSRYATRDARSSRTGYSSREHSGAYAAARTRRDSDYAARAAERLRYSEDDVRDVRSRYAGEGTRNVRSRSRDSRRSASDRGPIGGRAYSAQSRDAYADSRLAWDDSLDEEGVEQEELEPETLSRFEKLKRKHAKDKADRKFAHGMVELRRRGVEERHGEHQAKRRDRGCDEPRLPHEARCGFLRITAAGASRCGR